LENPKFFAFFFSKKNGLQKFRGKFYVLAALDDLLFGNPLQNSFVALVSLNFDAVNHISRWGLGRC